MKKICKRCKETKPLSDYYKHKQMEDGHLNFCKACKRQEAKSNYAQNIQDEQWLKKERKRTRERNKRLGYAQKYAYKNQPDAQKARILEAKNKWIELNQEKRKAHRAVNNAVRDGRLARQPCEICGALKVEGHHEDYSKPLDVVWLCRKHHAELHRKDKQL